MKNPNFAVLVTELQQLFEPGFRIDWMEGEEDEEASVQLVLDEEVFTLVMSADSMRVIVFADFGELDPQASIGLHRRILEINLALAAAGLGGIGIETDSDQLHLVTTAPLASTDASTLYRSLRNMAVTARSWRTLQSEDARMPQRQDAI